MRLGLIALYSLSALVFSAAVTGAWLLARHLAGRRPARRDLPRALLLAYLAALVQITALRLGLVAPRWLGGEIKLALFKTTLDEAAIGTWALVYNVLGNVLWFVPLGLLLPRLSPRWTVGHCLLAGATLSLAIETAQYLLGTGVSDVDDVLYNALGALLGAALRYLADAPRRRT